MKKLVCFIIIVSTIFLYGCSNAIINPDTSENEQTEAESTLPNINYNENVILPNVKVKSTNLAKEFKNLNLSNFTIINAIGDAYYGYKSTYSDNGINDEFMLIYSQSEKNEVKISTKYYKLVSWFRFYGSA